MYLFPIQDNKKDETDSGSLLLPPPPQIHMQIYLYMITDSQGIHCNIWRAFSKCSTLHSLWFRSGWKTCLGPWVGTYSSHDCADFTEITKLGNPQEIPRKQKTNKKLTKHTNLGGTSPPDHTAVMKRAASMKVSRQDEYCPHPSPLRGLPVMQSHPSPPISREGQGHNMDRCLHQLLAGDGATGALPN